MLKRLFLAGLAGALIAGASGCNAICQFHNEHLDRHFCGPSCGELYWSEWFSDPPDCCDPCNCCGNFATCRAHALRRRCDPYFNRDDAMTAGPMHSAGPAMIEGDAPPEMVGPVESY